MPPRARTAELPIALVTPVGRAQQRIGFTPCPGLGIGGLDQDLSSIRDWGATVLVTWVEQAELDHLDLPEFGPRARRAGLDWHHLPIPDMKAPDPGFDLRWQRLEPDLCARLDDGEGVVVHCRGAFGRSGTIAARLLMTFGMSPATAIERVRRARPGAIETAAQEAYLYALAVTGGQNQL